MDAIARLLQKIFSLLLFFKGILTGNLSGGNGDLPAGVEAKPLNSFYLSGISTAIIPVCDSYTVTVYGTSCTFNGVSVPSGYTISQSIDRMGEKLDSVTITGGSDSEIYYSFLCTNSSLVYRISLHH